MPVVDLTVDRNLLCPNFDGYKLCFDAVPVMRQAVDRDPLKLQPHLNQYSLLHVELFGRHNLLAADPWARHSAYYMNAAHELVLCAYDEQHGQPRDQRAVYSMPRTDHGDGDYNYTLRFISEKYCVLCDGILTYHLLETGDRTRPGTPWQLVTRSPILHGQPQRGFVLYDARLDIVQQCKRISLVAGHVERRAAATRNETDVHVMQLSWSRWTLDVKPEAAWTYNLCEQLEVQGSVYYCAFEPRAESLIVCSNGELQTRARREAVLAEKQAAETAASAAQSRPALENGAAQLEVGYSWTQTETELQVNFPLPAAAAASATRADFNVSCTSSQLLVQHHEQDLLHGALYAGVDEQLTSWTLAGEQLQLQLVKQESDQWPQLMQATMEAQTESELSAERLPIPNLEEPIEDCDYPLGADNVDIKMVRFNLSTSDVTHTIFLGATPPLFGSCLRAGFPAAFATRQGVDAAVWLQVYQPARPDEWSVRHEGNLHAFGYVQASKQQRKFIECCPDLDYAVIAESYRHVFIYKPRHDSAGGLRNRNGPQVVIGKQNLVTLGEDVGEVLGIATAPNVITVLTEHAVLYLQV